MKKMFNLNVLFVVMFIMLTSHILSIPIGEVVIIDIPWVLDMSDDGSVLVGGAEGGGGSYWTEETGVVIISATSEGSAISEDGIIAGEEINPDDYEAACWWDINILEPNFIGSVAGSTPMGNAINGANAISDDATTIVGLHWYNLGMGTAKAYKWTEETGCVLLPDVMDYSDSRADCVSADGSLIGGYAAEERSIWRPVLWNETEIIPLPYVHNESSVVKGISPNGEWCTGHNGNKGAIWHNQELVTLEGPDPSFIHTQFRTITEDGWAGGESANWNSMVSEPILWNPEDSLMNAIDFFEENGVTIPDDYELFRIRRISNDHLTFVCNGTDLNNYQYKSCILKILGPHSVSNFSAELEEYNNVHLTWNFDINTPGAQNIFINKDGEEIAQLDPSVTEYFDNDLDEGTYQYEIYVTYYEYDNSVSRSVEVEINLNDPLTGTVTIDAGGTGDYLTFGECFADLVLLGIDGSLNVEVMSGTYVESATLNGAIPGADASNLVHIYPVAGDVIIDGGANIYAIGLLNTSWIYFEGFELKLDGIYEFSNGVFLVENSTNIDISHCKLYDSGFVGLLLSNSQNIRFWNNFVYDTNAANLSLAMCGIDANIEIWNNSLHYNYPYFGGFFGPPAQCMNLTQSSANVHNNVLYKDVDDSSPMGSFGIINIELMGGVMADYYTADSFNNNCYYTVEGNTLFQVGFMEIYTTLTDLNTAYGFAANSVFGDPEYVDAANGNLNIESASSVCFDTGAAPARWFSDDINYETRQRWDIGADYIAPSIYSISGNIIASTSGPLANVIIRGSNTVPDSVITAEDGYYFFTALAALDITIIPEKEGYDFEPTSLVVNNIQEDTVQDFIAIEWTPNSPTDGLPQGTDVPINTAELSWTHPAEGVTPTQYLVTMSIEGIPVNGFNNVEVIYPINSLTIPGGTLIYSTSYQVEVTANYTAPVRSPRNITVNGDKRGDSAPLVWDFITENAPNTPPVADAGDDDEVLETAGSYTLDGTGSYDPDGQAITYFWDGELPLDDPTSATPTFNVPDVTEDTIFEFFLVVDDGLSREASEPDSVYITVLFVNQPPIADAGEDGDVDEGDFYQLDGTDSYDPDGQDITYLWTAPTGITLDDPTSATPGFTAPDVVEDTIFEFTLVVDDGYYLSTREESVPDYVEVRINFINQAPVADAGEDDSVTEGEEYQLDGTGSYDPDGQELTYQWIVPFGIQLSDPSIASPTFMAPEVNYDTEYEFELQVDDGYGREIDNDWVVITVLNYIDPNSVCATEPIPENGAQSVAIDAQVGWTYIHDDDYTEPLGFRVLVAYDEELTDPVEMYYSYEGEGVYLFEHSGPDFEYETQYFWQVIPTTDEERGDAVDCPVWCFTTVESPTYTVSGYVGVDLLVDLGSGYFTDTNGDYSITVLAGSDLTLTPVFEGYDFEPETVTFSDIQEDIIQNFIAESWCPEAPTDGLPQGPDIPIDVEELSWTPPAEGVTPTRYFITLSDHSNYMNPMLNAVETVEPHYSLEGIGLDYDTNYYVMVVPNFTPEGCEEGCDGPALEWNFTTVPLVHSNDPFLPVVTVLHGNYPNPFNPSTTISFSVKEGETGTLKIFNMIGQVVLSETFTVGEYKYEWSSRKNASGIYFYTLTTVSYSKVKKMILLK